MGIKALQVGRTFSHISTYDKRPPFILATNEHPQPDNTPNEEWKPTRWNLKVLDSRVLAILKDKSTKITIDPSKPDEEIGTQVNQNAYYYEVCALGLDNPEDFLNDKGDPVKWDTLKRNIAGKSYTVVSNETLGQIPDFVIQELAEKIIEGNTVTASEGNAPA